MGGQTLTFEAALAACRQGVCPFCTQNPDGYPSLRGVRLHLDNWHYGRPLWPQLDQALRKETGSL